MPAIRPPRYVRTRKLASGVDAYFWELPTWARPPAEKFGKPCPVQSAALGSDIPTMFQRADTLNIALDEWRLGASGKPDPGTVRALFIWYRTLDRFKDASFLTRRDYNRAMANVEAIQLKTKTMGEMEAAKITAVHADKVYKLALAAHGKRGGAYAMQICRRVWNEAGRYLNDKTCPVRLKSKEDNPFSKMNIKMVAEKGNRATTRAEYDAFRAKAREMGHQNMATAAAIAFELVRRVSDVFGYIREPGDEVKGFFWEDYERAAKMKMRQAKTGTKQEIPLAGEGGEPLYPALVEELARSWSDGATGHIVLKANGQRFDEDEAIRLFNKIRDAAGLPQNMTLTGFRHGGATELGDAGVVDIRSISGHKTLGQTLSYNKATERKARDAGQARRKHVTGGNNAS